jgi:hypothetical protein
MDLFKLRHSVTDYKQCRLQLQALIQKMINLRSQLTYHSQELLSGSVGGSLRASKLSCMVHSQYRDVADESAVLKSQLISVVQFMKESVCFGRCDPAVIALDFDYLKGFVSNVEQQLVLELSIADYLSDLDNVTEHDQMVTMMACYEYSPYLRLEDLDAVSTMIAL